MRLRISGSATISILSLREGFAAVIASELALGRTVAEARNTFANCANALFSSRIGFLRQSSLAPKFRPEPLRKRLDASFGKIMLGSEAFKTGICFVLN